MKTNYARFLKRTTAFVPATLLATVVSHANPLDGQVVAGSATITTPTPTTELINQQTNSAIINWKSFDIGTGETTQFIVPDYTGVTLNRVVGSQDPSKILGTLKSNGTVMVVNPDGILFGPHSIVDVGGLLATTSDIEDKDFMAKNYQFTKQGKSTASIVNQGMITVKDEGIAALVAPGVRNEGVITAKLGKVTLGAANKFTLDFYGDDLISLMLNDTLEGDVISSATGKPLSDKVANAGTIKADGGTVVLKAATARKVVNSVINNTGVIEANSVGLKNGKIILSAATAETKVADAPVQKVKVSGTLSASGKKKGEKGGKVYVTGEAVEVANAKINASGDAGGGAILIGGDYLGHKATDVEIAALGVTWESFVLSNATFVSLDDMTSINVDATTEGNGGKAVVWSDGATISAATITAKGGAVSGNGGFVETSGKYLDVSKASDASAVNGIAGTWLLDPLDVHIKNVPEVTVNTAFNVNIYNGIFGNSTFPTGPASVINVANVQAALNSGTNVRVTTRGTSGSGAGDIYIDNGITKSAGGNISVVIDSAHDVIFGSGVNLISTSGSVDLGVFAKNGSIIGNSLGQVKLNGGNLLLESTYGMTFRTNSDMPSNLYLRVNENGLSSGQTANIDVKFDQDTIKFTHTSTTATLPTGGIQLVDPTSSSFMGINFNALNVAFMDKSFVSKINRGWTFNVDPSKAFGAATGNALNGIAEIIAEAPVTIQPTSFGVAGVVPVFEIDSPDANNCPGNLTCVASGPEGLARINNYLHPVTVTAPITTPITTTAITTLPITTTTSVGQIGELLNNGTFVLNGKSYVPLSQRDASNYSATDPKHILDYYIVKGKKVWLPITELSCLAAVYTIIERANGRPAATIDNYYEVGPGATTAKGTIYLKSYSEIVLNYTNIQESLDRGDPVIANTTIPGENHFILIVGYTKTANTTTYSFIDPYYQNKVSTFAEGQEFAAAGRTATLQSIRTRG